MSLNTAESDSQEIGTEDNERIMLIGSDNNNEENLNGSPQADESGKMKEDAEEGELEDGELDDETEELCGHSDEVSKEPSPNGTSVVQVPESELVTVKSEKRKEKSDSERKSKGHSHHRSVPRTAPLDGIIDASKEDEGKDPHGRSQRHGKRRDKQRNKEDGEKKKTNYSTYIDFDDIQDDFETEDNWMHGSRSKRSRRSTDSLRGPYDSPSGSGDDDFDVDDDEGQSSSRNYRSQYQYNYGGFYEALPEEDEDDDDNDTMDQNSDYADSKPHYMKQPSQDGGYKGSPGCYRSSSSERKMRNQMPRKRKLVDTPMEERPACKFFREGKCVKGVDCPFNHDFVPPKREDVCRFYLNERGCTRDNCVFYHADWPCRYFHKTGTCTYGDSCKFSHADLTDETRHLIYLDSSDDYHSENWRPSSNNDLSQASEKKKIPSLLDMEIYPPGQEPKIPSSTFSPRPYKRQRSSGQPGLLGAGPPMSGGSGSRMSSRMRQMGGNSKGYFSSYGDQYNMEDSSPPHTMYSPDNNAQGEEDDEEPYHIRSDDEDQEPTTSTSGNTDMASGGQSLDVSSLPPVQRDLYRRIQQHQQFPQNTSSQTSNNNAQIKEKWYSSDEEGDGCDARASEATCLTSVTPADIIQSLAGQTSQMQQHFKPDQMQSMPSMFGMPPPCGPMPRGMPPPREMLHPPDMTSQGPRPMQGMPPRPEMMLPQRNMTPMSEMMSKGMGLMLPQTMAPPPDLMQSRCMMQPSDMMGQGMMLPRNMMGQGMMPPRGMMPPSDMMGHGMMPPRGMMPPSDLMGQGMMPPRGVPPPSDMMPLGMMQQRGMAPPSDMMPQGMMPPQGVKANDMPMRAMVPPGLSQPDGMPSPFNLQTQFDINHILSVIRNSTLQLPPNLLLNSTTSNDMMANASSNFNQLHDPRTSGNMVDPRLQISEPPPTNIGMMPVSSFLQPPESPDQEIEINATGKKIPFVLHPITVDSQPGPPSGINLENLQNSSDPRLQKYLNHNQANIKTRFGTEIDSSDSGVPAKPTDPRLSKRGASEAKNPADVESNHDGNKGTKQQKPYTLPDIVLPVLSNPVQEKMSTPKITDTNVSTRKTLLEDPAPRATSIPPPSIKPVDKTPQNLVELPEALQERNFPMDGRLSRQSSTGSVGHVSANLDKKVIDYRNDPRYKKKKTKTLEETSFVQTQKFGKIKEVVCPDAASAEEQWASECNIMTKTMASDTSVSQSPFRGNFKVQLQEFSETVQENETEVEESDSFNPESQKLELTSVHTPVTFFEGVPASSILSDVEPTQEINLKDMFKTIDPTTSPFC